jgi:hypothetical protein
MTLSLYAARSGRAVPEQQPTTRRVLKIVAKFLVSLVLTTVVCTAAWEVVNDRQLQWGGTGRTRGRWWKREPLSRFGR